MADLEIHLPLKPDVFLILTIVARREQYGYGIMQEAEQLTDGKVRLQPGALYRRLRCMRHYKVCWSGSG